MSLTNPPKRGLRGLGATASLGGRLRADRGADVPAAAQVARPLSLKAVRREMEGVKAVVREEVAAVRPPKIDPVPVDRGAKP